jgi:putative membrane protein
VNEGDFKRLSPLTPIVRGAIFFVAMLGAMWREAVNGQLGLFGLALIGVLFVGAVYGTASWLLTKYRIEGDELRVDTGVISRQSRRIRIDRLQGIDIVQPFVARLLGLAELKMDVAGGGRAEGSLAFLPLAEAQRVREQLLARRDAVTRPTEEPAAPLPETVLARLDLGMLVVSLVLSPEFIGFVLAVAAFVSLAGISGSIGAAGGLVAVIGGFGIVVVRRLAGFYKFTVSDTAAGMQVRRGLFELSSQTIALSRVQGVVVAEPLLWRPFGWARLDVSVAGIQTGGDSEAVQSSTVLPVGPRAQVMWLASYVLRGLDVDAVPLTPPPSRSGWLDPIGRHFLRAGLDDHLVVSSGGWFQRRTHAVPHRRVQSLRLYQGPLQRWLGLADVYVDSPPGPVHVRMNHRDAETARPVLEELARLSRLSRHADSTGPTPVVDTTQ